jgi:hypothetical protein
MLMSAPGSVRIIAPEPNCFFCSSSVAPDDVQVPGATTEIWLHRRHCAEEFGLGLVRLADWRRRSTHRGLGAMA